MEHQCERRAATYALYMKAWIARNMSICTEVRFSIIVVPAFDRGAAGHGHDGPAVLGARTGPNDFPKPFDFILI